MSRPNGIAGFLLRFATLYLLLIVPWPGLNDAYSAYFRALGRADAGLFGDRWWIRFEPLVRTSASPFDTRILVADRTVISPEGRSAAIALALDTRDIGWVPTALFLALVLATPLSWFRLAKALLLGLAAIHVDIALSVWVHVVTNAAELPGPPLVALPSFWHAVASGLSETLIRQLGASFTVPVVIWLLVSFRRDDWRPLWRPAWVSEDLLSEASATAPLRQGDIRANRREIV